MIFIIFLIGILNQASWIQTTDQHVIAFVTRFHVDALKPILIVITELGNPSILIFLTLGLAGVLLIYRYRIAALFTASVGAMMGILNIGIKYLVQRPRPFIADPQIRFGTGWRVQFSKWAFKRHDDVLWNLDSFSMDFCQATND